MINLKNITDRLNFTPRVLFEVGVCQPHDSHVKDFLDGATKAVLFEPHPFYFARLKLAFGENSNVTIHNVAIYKEEGTVKLFNRNASTFVEGVQSPAKVNDGYSENESDVFAVKADTFDKYDTGDIDLLAIDTEGCEWFAIQKMKSRPRLICVETHGMRYTNPYLKEILLWMDRNGYKALETDASDTIFVKN